MTKRFDSVLLGDNAFYGVDHLSHSRARKRIESVQSIENAVKVIKCAHDNGIDGMVVATRPKLKEIVQELESKSTIADNLDFYPVMPYAQGLQLKLSEKGILNLIKEIMSAGGIKEEIRIITKGGLGFMKKDFDSLFRVFIDTEMIKLKIIHPKIIYLHPVIVDLALALNLKNVFNIFQDHLNKYGIKAGLCTKNFKWLVEKLDEWDMKFESIMTSFNPVGFLMNPSKRECEQALNNYEGHVLAMNIFGGGFVSLDEVIGYLKSQPKIKNVVVGISSVEHAKETFSRLVEMQK